jgi:hypothetical protein
MKSVSMASPWVRTWNPRTLTPCGAVAASWVTIVLVVEVLPKILFLRFLRLKELSKAFLRSRNCPSRGVPTQGNVQAVEFRLKEMSKPKLLEIP